MNFNEYQTEATKTWKNAEPLDRQDARVVNWALGVANEAGELAGEIKHVAFHGEKLNKMKIAKEVGDVLWYLSSLCQSIGISLADCAELNVVKLRHRHGDSFSFEGSHKRHANEMALESTAEYKRIRNRILD